MEQAIEILTARMNHATLCAEAWEKLGADYDTMERRGDAVRYYGWAMQKRDIVAELLEIIEEMKAVA